MNRPPLGDRSVLIELLTLAVLLIGGSRISANDQDALGLDDSHFSQERIDGFIKLLGRKTAEDRIYGAEALAEIGPEARAAIPKLIPLLEDERFIRSEFGIPKSVNEYAQKALTSIGSEAVDEISKRLEDLPTEAMQHAVFASRMMGFKARALLPVLIQHAANNDIQQSWGIVDAIAAIDPTGDVAIPFLVKTLAEGDEEADRRSAAIWLTRSDSLELVYWREKAPAAQWFRKARFELAAVETALVAALSDKSPEVRGPVTNTISTYPNAAARAMPVLIKLLKDEGVFETAISNHFGGQTGVAPVAVETLSKMKDRSDEIIPILMHATAAPAYAGAKAFAELVPHSKDPKKHLATLLEGEHPEHAFAALARLGTASRWAVPKLELFCVHKDQEIAAQAMLALYLVDPQDRTPPLGVFKQMLDDKNQQYDLTNMLIQLGPASSFAVPLLQKHLEVQPDQGLNEYHVMHLLSAIGPPAATAAPAIINELNGVYTELEEDDLVQIGPLVVPHVVASLKATSKTPMQQFSYLRVLGRFGNKAAEAVPVIITIVDSEYPRVREAAVMALGRIASRPEESLPALVKRLADPRPFVREKAALSCGQYGPAAAPIVPELIKKLSDDYLDVQVAAATALSQLGPTAKLALPDLERLHSTDNALLRDTVREAIEKVKQ